MGYTTDRTIQILISLLKEHHIRKVVASPGTTNAVFVASLQNDPFFEMYSSVDERSAAYIACGLSQESGEPVVITCTEATASRNYLSALTEAHYRKLPICAITGYHHLETIGQLYPQSIDRSVTPKDTVNMSVDIATVHDKNDEWKANFLINKALLALKHRGGGPVHINLQSSYKWDLKAESLPEERKIELFDLSNQLPDLPHGRIAIVVGAHKRFSSELTNNIDKFCSNHNAVVFASHISGYQGCYKVNPTILGVDSRFSFLFSAELVIHIGEIDAPKVHSPHYWRVSEDGIPRDTFKNLTYMFDMDESSFFKNYISKNTEDNVYYKECIKAVNENELVLDGLMDKLPFSSTWIASKLHNQIPSLSVIHFGILNSYRTWGYFSLPEGVEGSCNVGGYGIDGGLSTLLGSSLASPTRLHFGVFGDLAFFYDMNCLGNRYVGKNLRILLINNGKGQEFRNCIHPAYKLGEIADDFVAAAGHYGNKSSFLVRHYAEDLGFEYLTASTKEEFLEQMGAFTRTDNDPCSIIFEVFIEGENESASLGMIQKISETSSDSLKKNIKSTLYKVIGEDKVSVLKGLIKR